MFITPLNWSRFATRLPINTVFPNGVVEKGNWIPDGNGSAYYEVFREADLSYFFTSSLGSSEDVFTVKFSSLIEDATSGVMEFSVSSRKNVDDTAELLIEILNGDGLSVITSRTIEPTYYDPEENWENFDRTWILLTTEEKEDITVWPPLVRLTKSGNQISVRGIQLNIGAEFYEPVGGDVHYNRVGGGFTLVPIFVKAEGEWRNLTKVYVKSNGKWR